MKNFYDKLIEYAYDELDASNAQEVERLVDHKPQLLKEVKALRQSRELLKMLPEAPPPSLSKERLQQAILDRELSHRCAFAWPKWIGAGAFVALVFFVVFAQQNPSIDTHVARSNDANVFANKSNDILDRLEEVPMIEITGAAIESAMKDAVNRIPKTMQESGDRHSPPQRIKGKNDRLVIPKMREEAPPHSISGVTTLEMPSPPAEIIVIEPSSGSASEFRSTDDFAIGG